MIHVNRLLRQREEIYADILDCEERIHQALGKKYPLSRPPELPSIFRAPSKAKKKRTKTRQIRKLNPAKENAYRITFIMNEEANIDLVRDVRLVRRLLTFNIPFFTLVKIETVRIFSTEQIEAIELLYYNRNMLETTN